MGRQHCPEDKTLRKYSTSLFLHILPTSQVTARQQMCVLAQNSMYSPAGLRHCFFHIKGVFENSGAKTPRTLLLKQQSDLLMCSHLNVVSGPSTHTNTIKADQVGQEWLYQQANRTGTVPFRPISVEWKFFLSQETLQRNDLDSYSPLTNAAHNFLWTTQSDHKCQKPQNLLLDLKLFYI